MFGSRGSAAASLEEKDPERILKLKECCDMLLAGGYFRARIPTLSPFDKVVGGMVWSITGSGVDVDVDIIFQENSTIGQKIKLSDQLVRALVKMSCPHPLQSHQIQGLDYDHLFPVVQWLVRKVIETRRLTGDLVRQLSVSQYSKVYASLPSELTANTTAAITTTNILQDKYKPQRKFKKRNDANFESDSSRVDATLLEYGEKLFSSIAHDEEREENAKEKAEKRGGNRNSLIAKFEQSKLGSGQSAGSNEKQDEAARKAAEEREAARLASLRDQLAEGGNDAKISGGNVGALVNMQADEIKRAAEEYEQLMRKQQEEEEATGAASGRGATAAFNRQVDNLRRKIAAQKEVIEKKQSVVDELEKKSEELNQLLEKKQAYIGRIERENDKLVQLENQSENREILSSLRALVTLNESLKQQEALFKASCVQQRQDLMSQLSKIEGDENDEEMKRMLEIEKLYENDLSKLNKIRKVLAKKNQEISKLARAIDEVPTRAELLQYERRFVELYELSSEKLVETRKFYSMYNTLTESLQYMQNEVNLLNSIIEGFSSSSSTPKGRDNFLVQIEKILDGLDKTKQQVLASSESENTSREVLTSKYNTLVEKQRSYFKAVKEFQEECFKNEKLQEKIEEMERESNSASSAETETSQE